MTASSDPSAPRYSLSYSHTGDGRAHVTVSEEHVEIPNYYQIGDETITRAFGSTLPPELADLVDIAMAVYFADRLSPRRRKGVDPYALNWTRRFEVQLPVRDPERWQDQAATRQLTDALWYFTEDNWTFKFVPRQAGLRRSETEPPLFSLPLQEPVAVSLFSGGLDSVAGLSRQLTDCPNGTYVLFSASTNRLMGAVQRRLVRTLRRKTGCNIVPVTVPFSLVRRDRPYGGDERSQRSRGFVFTALGAVAAIQAGVKTLSVFENGIGAINLPYTSAELGTHSTRAVNPVGLDRMAKFVKSATDVSFQFELPFLFHTKAEVCKHISGTDVCDIVAGTVSCDGFPQRVAGKLQCGVCASCILRRLGLYIADLAAFDDSGHYRFNIIESVVRIPESKLYPLRVMLDQAARLQQAVNASEPWRSLSRLYPQLVEVAGHEAAEHGDLETVQAELVSLYRRYCEEWERFPARPPAWPVELAG